MDLTLYIDESGDFVGMRGEWVIAGLLCEVDRKTAERNLSNLLGSLPSQFGLSSLEDIHLTELRDKFGHVKAVDIARTLLSTTKKFPFKTKLLTAVNYAKRGLGVREQTYRLMLLDLLALAESSISDGKEITSLEMVVATRTINGKLATTEADLKNDVINSLPSALEMGLASRGLIELAADNRVRVMTEVAGRNWGIAIADSLANLTHNRRFELNGALLATAITKSITPS